MGLASVEDRGFSRTVSCVPVVLKRRYCLRISLTISNLCAISPPLFTSGCNSSLSQSLARITVAPPLFTSGCRFLAVAVSGSNHDCWRCPARGGKRLQIRRRGWAESYIHAGPRVRAVYSWFCCDDLARSCSLHSATRVGLRLVYYQIGHAPVSLVMVEECRQHNRCSKG